jgi:hypothetical protein
MLRRLFRGPLSGQDREVPDGAEVYEVPFVSVPGGTREVGDDTKPSGYWLYSFSGTKWVFAGIKDATSVDPPQTKALQDYCEVDEPGDYILDNGDVIDIMRDLHGFYYGMYRGLLCTIESTEDRRTHRIITVKNSSSCGVIVDKGSWCPATFSDLNFAPVRARFYIGTDCVDGMLAGVRHTEKGWRWIASSGDEFEHCQVIKRLSELPF